MGGAGSPAGCSSPKGLGREGHTVGIIGREFTGLVKIIGESK
jgi:hypothetical protein